jgi:hypothetical protein
VRCQTGVRRHVAARRLAAWKGAALRLQRALRCAAARAAAAGRRERRAAVRVQVPLLLLEYPLTYLPLTGARP